MRRRTVTGSVMTLMMRRSVTRSTTTTAATTMMTKHPAWSWPAAIAPTSRYYTNKDGLVSLLGAGSFPSSMNLYDCNLKCAMWVVYMFELSPICVLMYVGCAVRLSIAVSETRFCLVIWSLLLSLCLAPRPSHATLLLALLLATAGKTCARGFSMVHAEPCWSPSCSSLWSFSDFAYTFHTRFPFMNLLSKF